MRRRLSSRIVAVLASAGLLTTLFWLDQNRGGPASMMSRCNLLLSRSETPPADILIVGSSRAGAALDPVAMQKMLAYGSSGTPTVERIALGHNPLRATHALLETYLDTRGVPRVIVLEIMFMTERSVERLAKRSRGLAPEHYIFVRDVNLLTFAQLLRQPSVAMPFTESEGWFNRWRFRLRGVVLRAGALAYQFLRHPTERWRLAECGRAETTREPEWPADFAFSHGDYEPNAPPLRLIESLEAEIVERSAHRDLKPWQVEEPETRRYPYDFDEPYRRGEVAHLKAMIRLATERGSKVILLPLPIYGQTPDPRDLRTLDGMLPDSAHVFYVYGAIRRNFDRLWYDDAHVDLYPTGALTTALVAQHLLDVELVTAD